MPLRELLLVAAHRQQKKAFSFKRLAATIRAGARNNNSEFATNACQATQKYAFLTVVLNLLSLTKNYTEPLIHGIIFQ